MKMTRVGIDLDGCAYPFVDEIREYAEERLGYELPPFVHWNSHQKHWGLTNEQLHDLMKEALVKGRLWKNKQPAEGFRRALERLQRHGCDVIIATDRLQGTAHESVAHTVTTRWLHENKVSYDDILFTSDKRVANCDFFIEDRPQAVPLLRLAGTDAVYMDRPWNSWLPGPRVTSWDEFVDYVLERKNG